MEKHSCETCKHFIQHYSKNIRGFHTVCCGHCRARRLTPKEQRSFPLLDGCEMWEEVQQIKIEEKYDVKNLLQYIRHRLDDLLTAIETDERNSGHST